MRAPSSAAVIALACAACNLIFGLDEGSERAQGGGGDPPVAGGGGATSSSGGAPNGGGGTDPSSGGSGGDGGDGGDGGSTCRAEESAGPGAEALGNGSFELGNSDWSAPTLTITVVDEGAFCGCRAGAITLPGAFDDIRHLDLPVPVQNASVHAQVRIRAPDSVDAEMLFFQDSLVVEPPVGFMNDADDEEGVDGWRLATAEWFVGEEDWVEPFLQVAFTGSAGEEVLVDCASVTYEDP